MIFDLVFNHAGGGFGDQTMWFFDRQHGIEEPRWWNSLYFSDKTWAGGVVFNFQSDPVRAFLIDNARFLLDEYRVDGFRFDEVSVIDHNSYGRGWDFCQDLTEDAARPSPGRAAARGVLERQSVDREGAGRRQRRRAFTRR